MGRLCSQFDNICGAEWCLMSTTYWVIGTGSGMPRRGEIKRNSLVAGDMEKGMWLSTSFTVPASKGTKRFTSESIMLQSLCKWVNQLWPVIECQAQSVYSSKEWSCLPSPL